MANKLYILIEPNLETYDKICTKEAVYEFTREIADDLDDKDILDNAYNRDDKSKDGTDYFDNLVTMLLEASGYKVIICESGLYTIEEYFMALQDIAPDRDDVKRFFA